MEGGEPLPYMDVRTAVLATIGDIGTRGNLPGASGESTFTRNSLDYQRVIESSLYHVPADDSSSLVVALPPSRRSSLQVLFECLRERRAMGGVGATASNASLIL